MIAVKLKDKTVIKLEEDLLEKFKESCNLYQINYREAKDGDLQLIPALSGITIVLIADNNDNLNNLAISIKQNLEELGASCIITRQVKGTEGQALIYLSQGAVVPGSNNVKFYHSPDALNLASKIITALSNSEIKLNYSTASWWERFINFKFRHFISNSLQPAILLEFNDWVVITKAGNEIAQIISNSLFEHFKSATTSKELKTLADLVREIHSEIKAEKNISAFEEEISFKIVDVLEEESPADELEITNKEKTTDDTVEENEAISEEAFETDCEEETDAEAKPIKKAKQSKRKPKVQHDPFKIPGGGKVFRFSRPEKHSENLAPLQQNIDFAAKSTFRQHSTKTSKQSLPSTEHQMGPVIPRSTFRANGSDKKIFLTPVRQKNKSQQNVNLGGLAPEDVFKGHFIPPKKDNQQIAE